MATPRTGTHELAPASEAPWWTALRWGSPLWDVAPAAVWRMLHPLTRDPFVPGHARAPLPLIEATSGDGWTVALRRLPLALGAAGEPVLLLPTVGVTGEVFRLGAPSLADRLAAAGFAVFLGDSRLGGARADAAAPTPDFDDAACRDVAAQVDAVARFTGYPRVHVVGHGLGGQLALAWAARGGDGLASLAVLSAPVRFPEAPPALAGLVGVAGRVAGGWRMPWRELSRWRAVMTSATARREALAQAGTDVPAAVATEIAAWFRHGALVERGGALDYGAGLGRVRGPLWVATAPDDRWCPPAWAQPVRQVWSRGRVTCVDGPDGVDHLGLVVDRAAGPTHEALAAWLGRHRVRAWQERHAP